MSDKRIIRINKVLRELNISLDRAVDYLKTNGFEIESSPNAKISEEEYDVLNKQFSADKGRKVASQEVSEEKKKEKEQLRIEREKELEEKRRREEEEKRAREEEIIRAKAEKISTIKPVGKIELEPKKKTDSTATPSEQVNPSVSKDEVVEKKAKTQVASDLTKEEKREGPRGEKTQRLRGEEATSAPHASTEASETEGEDGVIKTQYRKLSGATFTGQKIDLAQFEKPKKKKEDKKAKDA